MTVVPGSTELGCLERICSTGAWRNRAFSKTADAIRSHAVELSDTVPMNTSAVVLKRVLDIDDDLVTPVSGDGGTRELIVDEVTLHVAIAIEVACCVSDLKVVGNSVSCSRVLQIKVCLDAVSATPALTRVWSIGARSISHQRS